MMSKMDYSNQWENMEGARVNVCSHWYNLEAALTLALREVERLNECACQVLDAMRNDRGKANVNDVIHATKVATESRDLGKALREVHLMGKTVSRLL
jgi:hypothetical protein